MKSCFVLLLAFSSLTVGCARAQTDLDPKPAPSGPPAVSAHATIAPSLSAKPGEISTQSAALGGTESLRDLGVRFEIDKIFDRLVVAFEKSASPGRAEVALALAYVSLELGRLEKVASALEVAAENPLFVPIVEKLRRRAFLLAPERFDSFAFEGKARDPEFLFAKAKFENDGGRASRALELLLEATASLEKNKRQRDRQEPELRALLAETREKLGELASARREYEWLWEKAPLRRLDATPFLKTVSPAFKPNKKTFLARAETLAEAGRSERLRAHFDSGFGKIERCDRDRLLARSLYQERNYEEAAKSYEKASESCGASRGEVLFLRARSLLRAQKDEEAIALFSKLSKSKESDFADRASYQLARALLFAGQLEKARLSYKSYLARFGKKGTAVTEARRELGLLHLLLGEIPEARHDLGWKTTTTSESSLLALLLSDPKHPENSRADLEAIAKRNPLSLPGLLARAKLEESGSLEPLGPPPPVAFTSANLPPEVARIDAFGLGELSELALEQHESTLRLAYGARSVETLCFLYREIGSGRRRYQIARSNIAASRLAFPISSDQLWAFDCSYPKPYEAIVRSVAEKEGFDPYLLYGVMRQESAFDRKALSPAEAFGLLQMIPKTKERVAGELGDPPYLPMTDPRVSIRYGGHYLKKLLDRFGGNVPVALAAYNAGPLAVARWLTAFRGARTEVFVALIPYAETRHYVEIVLENYARYAYLYGAPNAVPKLALTVPPPPSLDDLY